MLEMIGPVVLITFGVIALVGGTVGHRLQQRRRA